MKSIVISFLILTASYFPLMAQNKQTTKTPKGTKADLAFVGKVLTGKVHFYNKEIEIDSLVWNQHPKFKGVYLKHLILGKDTKDQLSLHIVKIEPNCILDTHSHDGKSELHEVIGGSATMYLEGAEIKYSAGQICLIPANTPHKIVAGKDGLYLFAHFNPALQ